MIVCICKSISERKIRASIAQGAGTFDELQFELGVASCCGKCEESVRDLMVQCGACETLCGGAHHSAPSVPITFYTREAA